MPDQDRSTDDVARATVVGTNSTRASAPWLRSTGFQTASLRHRALEEPSQPRLAEQFLIASRLLRSSPEALHSVASYFTDASQTMLSVQGEEPALEARSRALPASTPLRMSVGDAISQRRSNRRFTGDPIEPEHLAALVRAAGGITGAGVVTLADGAQRQIPFRSTPSGGGLYPNDLLVVATRVAKVPQAVYRYQPNRDVLVRTAGRTRLQQLQSCFAVTKEAVGLDRTAAIFLLIGRPWKSMRKYGDRGMRFVLMEAGYVAQNLHLAATALGLGSVDCASVYDDEVHEVLGLDGVFECLVHVVLVGRT